MKSTKLLIFFSLSVLFIFTEQSNITENAEVKDTKFIDGANITSLTPVQNSNNTTSQSTLYKAYFYEQTLIIQKRTKRNSLIKCLVERYHNPVILEKLEPMLKELNTTLVPVTFKKFNFLMKKCDALDNTINLKRSKPASYTKWCTGEKGKYYHHLGIFRDMDRCCREHSLCPINIKKGATKYNLTNNGSYGAIAYHCHCERKFRNCLEASKTSENEILSDTALKKLKDELSLYDKDLKKEIDKMSSEEVLKELKKFLSAKILYESYIKNVWFSTIKYCIDGIPGQNTLSFKKIENVK